MDEIEQALARLKRERAPLDRKVNGLLHVKFGVRVVGSLMILCSAVVWGGLPLSLLGGGTLFASFLIPNGPDSGPMLTAGDC